MSLSVEQLAAELQPLAAADFILLPPLPPPPKPVPAKPAVAPKPATAGEGGPTPTAPAQPAAPAATPAPLAPSPAPVVVVAKPQPIQVVSFADKGIHLDACITPDKVVDAAKIMERHGFAIDAVTGMDWLAQGLMEVVYDFLHFQSGMRVAIRTRISRANPRVDTISNIFQGANWHERETHDMFGIVFIGHPDLTPFLLPDDADFHPLRKDYNP